MFLSVSEYAKKYNKDVGNIRRFLIQGRIQGQKIGNQWVIEDTITYPDDKRIKSGIYIKQRKLINFRKNKELSKNIDLMVLELVDIYKDYINEIILYGSYARGDETSESDIDIALILKENKKENTDKMIDCVAKYELNVGKVLSVIEIDENKFKKYAKILPFYENINTEGILLWKKK